ncbi:MAG TPA: hypothetical protein PK867_19250, partial [Pirellulales bacterium]|nr:hypothetical protein [Pirellulales bacterium]
MVAIVIVVVAFDNLFWPGPSGRALLLLAIAVTTLLSVGAWIVRRWLDDRRDDFFAALAESRHPELANRLINGLQLGRGTEPGSPRLIEAIVRDAVSATAELDMADALDRRPLGRSASLLAITVFLLVCYSFSPRFANGLERVLAPWADIPPYTATQVAKVTPGDKQVIEGSPVPITAELAGVLPDTAQLLLHQGDGRKPLAMRPLDSKRPGLFGVTLREANESFDYYIAAGDGRSRHYRISVVERPRVEKLSLRVTPPAYTALPASELRTSDGEIAGLCGSTVEIELQASKPLKTARLVLDAGEPIELARASDDNSWRAKIVLWSDKANDNAAVSGRRVMAPARYQIQLAATDGSDLLDPLWRSITLAEDQPPTVAITTPGRDVQLKPDETLAIEAIGKDDYGVGQIRLLYRVNDRKEPRELATFALREGSNEASSVAGAEAGRVRLGNHEKAPSASDAPVVALPGHRRGGALTQKLPIDRGSAPATANGADSGKVRYGRATERKVKHDWQLASGGLKAGDSVQYWAEVADRNDITGPGIGRSPTYSLFIKTPEQILARLEFQLDDYAQVLEELIRLQSENRAQTAAAVSFETLVVRQTLIRAKTLVLSRAMTRDAVPIASMIEALDELDSGLMADCIRLLEAG